MSAALETAGDPRTGLWRVQSSVWHRGTGSAYLLTVPVDRRQRSELGAHVHLTCPRSECDASRADRDKIAVQVAAATVLISALQLAGGSSPLP